MKIASSDVTMASQHTYTNQTSETESLKMWNNQGSIESTQTTQTASFLDSVDFSAEARNYQLNNTAESKNDAVYKISEADKRKIELIEKLLKQLTGKKVRLIVPKEISINSKNADASSGTAPQGSQGSQGVGWGLMYDKTTIRKESEQTGFAMSASIVTEDGREITVDMSLSLSREYLSYESISIRAGDAEQVDPLVLNFGTASAVATESKYAFDIDADGTTEQISFVGPGSGFLALDANRDGIINDGSELFGPRSGSGFSDLAEYDSDNNGWIDENDEIFDNLQIWSKDADGRDSLVALGQQGIGAIYLGSVSTAFALKGQNNQTNAQLQKTGFFLRENGTAGTVQHVDMVI